MRSTRLLLVATLGLWACPAEQKTTPATPDASPSAEAPKAIEVPPGTGPVAKVGGIDIPRELFNREFVQTVERYQKARHEVKPALRERLKDNIVRRLVDAEVITQQAKKMGVELAPAELAEKWEVHKKRYGSEEAFKAFLERAGTSAEDVQRQFEQNLLREKVFAKASEAVTVDEAEVKDFFEKNRERYDEPEQVKASHILIRVAPNAPAEEKAAKKKRAEEALAAVKKKGAKFETLAAEFGEDPTKDRGGDLGFFQKGRMVKPFEDAVWGMKVGQITGPIETQFGFHVIKKMEVKAARKRPFGEVKDQIEKSLVARKRNQAIRDSLEAWKKEANIEIIEKGDPAIMAEAPAGAGLNLENARPQIQPLTGPNARNPEEIRKLPPNGTSDKPVETTPPN